jgi:hypothetical protein
MTSFQQATDWLRDAMVQQLKEGKLDATPYLENTKTTMRVNTRAVLEDCLERAVMHALRNIDDALTDAQTRQLERKLEQELWLQIDTYFSFEGND